MSDTKSSTKSGVTMELKVDGKEVEIGSFVQSIVSSGILGMVSQLKGVDAPREIQITIRLP